MALACPDYVKQAGVIGVPPAYAWNNDVALKLYAAKDQNARLYRAVDASSFKAKMSTLAIVTEWIICRFEGLADLTDAKLRVEAAWAAAIHPAYAKSLGFKMTKDPNFHNAAPVEGPVEIALAVLGRGHDRYTAGSIYLAEMVVKQAVLARYLMPGPKAFDAWLSDALKRAAALFPRTTEYDTSTGIYDATAEKPVPREFFDTAFQWSEAAAAKAIRDFLATLHPQSNPYLRSPDEMTAAGFPGKPYSF